MLGKNIIISFTYLNKTASLETLFFGRIYTKTHTSILEYWHVNNYGIFQYNPYRIQRKVLEFLNFMSTFKRNIFKIIIPDINKVIIKRRK